MALTATGNLIVSRLPTALELGVIDEGQQVMMFQTLQALHSEGKIRPVVDSIGYALARPNSDWLKDWDDPEELIWFVMHTGPDGERYAANAVRKLRAMAREGVDTLQLSKREPWRFQNPVDSQTDSGCYPWGDYPWGGAIRMQMFGLDMIGAVSCYEEEDDGVAAAVMMSMLASNICRSQFPS